MTSKKVQGEPRATNATLLAEARSVLVNGICECSHLDSEHAYRSHVDPASAIRCWDGRCRCRRFRPVQFVVTLAKGAR